MLLVVRVRIVASMYVRATAREGWVGTDFLLMGREEKGKSEGWQTGPESGRVCRLNFHFIANMYFTLSMSGRNNAGKTASIPWLVRCLYQGIDQDVKSPETLKEHEANQVWMRWDNHSGRLEAEESAALLA